MPLIKRKSDAAFKANLKGELAAGKPKNQALAIAYRVQREAKKAGGGAVMPSMKMGQAGFIHSNVAGRTDKLPMKLRTGSYVIPAATVSALGEGNSIAGAHALDKLFGLGPYGSAKTKMPYGAAKPTFADGGSIPAADVIVAGGEYIVSPDKVSELGNGSLEDGHNVLDQLVKHIKSKTIKTLKKLPNPKNS